jgi:HEAT repeat protein/energy-coupling factor transporter ATP-binding protein EcfA2
MSSICPLDDILVTPSLLPQPTWLHPFTPQSPEWAIERLLVYSPECPEIYKEFPTSRISIAEAISNGAHIAIMGQPGSGKTVALAHLASLISRKDAQISSAESLLPIYFHALDLDPKYLQDTDPLQAVIHIESPLLPRWAQEKFSKLLNVHAQSGRILLIIDGLDELSPAHFQMITSYLNRLIQSNSSIQLVTAVSPDYLGDIVNMGVVPLPLAGWNKETVQAFYKKCAPILDAFYSSPKEQKTYSYDLFTPAWLAGTSTNLLPVYLTFQIWTAFSGALTGTGESDAIRSFIRMTAPNTEFQETLNLLAGTLIGVETIDISPSSAQKFISSKDTPLNYRTSSGLIETGLFQECSNKNLRFSHPIFLAYFYGQSLQNITEEIISSQWSVVRAGAHFFMAGNVIVELKPDILETDPFAIFRFSSLLSSETQSLWKNEVLRRLAGIIQDSKTLISTKTRALNALVSMDDPSISKLFRYLLKSPDPSTRVMAALGLGACGDQGAITELTNLIMDAEPSVQQAACFAIGALKSEASERQLLELFKSENEDVQTAAAEILCTHVPVPEEVFKQAIASTSLLNRKAAIMGLARIREEWSRALLEKTSVEEGNWVIRNAAAQALEGLSKPLATIPMPLPAASEAPWLIRYASEHGLGIPSGSLSVEMLLQALNTGNLEEQLAAIIYLRKMTTPEIKETIEQISSTGHWSVQEASMLALWYYQVSTSKPEYSPVMSQPVEAISAAPLG